MPTSKKRKGAIHPRYELLPIMGGMIALLVVGGILGGWATLAVLGGERQRRLAELAARPPVEQTAAPEPAQAEPIRRAA